MSLYDSRIEFCDFSDSCGDLIVKKRTLESRFCYCTYPSSCGLGTVTRLFHKFLASILQNQICTIEFVTKFTPKLINRPG